MNFEAWQSQQKALKDEERKRKSAAAEALQSYRGGVSEEDTKLTTLREQERKKKLEAERKMRDYRGGVSEEDTKLAILREEERQKRFEAERGIRDYRANGGSSKKPVEERQDASTFPEMFSPSEDNSLLSIAPGAVSAMAGKFRGGQEDNEPKPLTELSNTTSQYHNDYKVHQNDNSFNQDKKEQTPSQSFEAQNVQPQEVDAPTTTQEIMDSDSAFTHSCNINAQFAFGLISNDKEPAFSSYLVPVKAILQQLFVDDNQISQTVSFGAATMTNISKDDTYLDSFGRTRHVVTVSIPVVAPNVSVGHTYVNRIVTLAREAVQNGSFKKPTFLA